MSIFRLIIVNIILLTTPLLAISPSVDLFNNILPTNVSVELAYLEQTFTSKLNLQTPLLLDLGIKLRDANNGPSALFNPYTRNYRDGLITIRTDCTGDPLVLAHEYVHAISNRLNTSSRSDVNLQSRSIDEGIAQYLACSIYNTSQYQWQGETVSLENNLHYPEDYHFSTYADSYILMGALWDLRTLIGADSADQLLLQSLNYRNSSYATLFSNLLKVSDHQFGNHDGNYLNDPYSAFVVQSFVSHGLTLSTPGTNFAAENIGSREIEITLKPNESKTITLAFRNDAPGRWVKQNSSAAADAREIWLSEVLAPNTDLAYDYDSASTFAKLGTMKEPIVVNGKHGTFELAVKGNANLREIVRYVQPLAFQQSDDFDPNEKQVVALAEPVKIVIHTLD